MLLKTSRRTFLKGLTLSGVAGSLGVWSFNARSSLSLPVAASLQGTQFVDLPLYFQTPVIT